MAKRITIGKLSTISGVSTRTIRHYEEIGLIECAAKTEANYRLYGKAEIKRLEKILLFKSLGFSLEEIKTILETEENEEVAELFEQRMAALDQKISEISRYKEMLEAITKIYKLYGLEYVNNYHLLKEMVCMNNMFVKNFQNLSLKLQIKVLKEIYATGSLSPETLKEMVVKAGANILKELHMIIIKVLLNRVEPTVERDLIRSLENTDPEFAESIKKAMFTFEDIVMLPDQTIAKWLAKSDDHDLAIALRDSSKYMRNRILHLLPENRTELLCQALEDQAEPSMDEVYQATTNLVKLLHEMELNGDIKIERFN